MISRNYRRRHSLVYVALGSLLVYSVVAVLAWRGVSLQEMLPLRVLAEVRDPQMESSDSPVEVGDPPPERLDSRVADPGSEGTPVQDTGTAEARGQEEEQLWEPPPGPSFDEVVGRDPGYGAWPTSSSLPNWWRDPGHEPRAVDDPLRRTLRILAGHPSDGEVAARVAPPSAESEQLLLETLRLLEGGQLQGP